VGHESAAMGVRYTHVGKEALSDHAGSGMMGTMPGAGLCRVV